MRTTTEEFDKRVAESGVKAIRLSEYISNSKKVKFVCPVHNIKFEQYPSAIYKGYSGCRFCRKNLEDFTGRKIGLVTVIEPAIEETLKRKDHKTVWKCVCECQKNNTDKEYCYYTSEGLNRNLFIGCDKCKTKLIGQSMKSKWRVRNRYEIKDEYVVVFDKNNRKFYIDIDDLDKVSKYTFFMDSNGYIQTRDRNTKEIIYLHRYVMDVTDSEMCVDHINHDTSDNRKKNLRVATRAQNMWNSQRNYENKILPRGVSISKTGKYTADIIVNRKEIRIGTFELLDDAIKARKEQKRSTMANLHIIQMLQE